MKQLSFLMIILLTFASCKDKEEDQIQTTEINQLIFGHYNGMCPLDCVDIYKIEDGKLYKDDMNYFIDSLSFDPTPLSDDKYHIAVELITSFPDQLFANRGDTFGCPDCADQGGVIIEAISCGETDRWHADTSMDQLPAYLQPYITDILNKIQALN